MGQHEARHPGIDDRSAVRAAIAQAQQRSRISEHLADWLMVAADVVHQREEEISVLGLRDVIVGHLIGRAPLPRRDRSNALFTVGLVVGRIAHDKKLVPALDDKLAELRESCHFGWRRFLVENPAPDFWVTELRTLLSNAEFLELSVCWPHCEWVERSPDTHHDANRPPGNLRGQ